MGWLLELLLTKTRRFSLGPDASAVTLILLASAISSMINLKSSAVFTLYAKEILQFFVFFIILINYPHLVRKIIMCLILSSSVSAIAAFYQYHLLGYRQAIGFMGNPNVFSAYIAALLPIVLGVLFERGSKQKKIVLGMLISALLLTLLFAGSRTSLVLGVMGITVMCLLSRYRIAIIGSIILIAFVMISFFISGPVIDSTISRFSWPHLVEGLAMRINIWSAGLESIAEFPVFGVGPGNFNLSVLRLAMLKVSYPDLKNILHAHNVFLQIWVEFGFLAPISFILLLLNFIRRIKHDNLLSRRSLSSHPLGTAVTISLLIVIIQLFFDYQLCASSYAYFVLCLLAYYSATATTSNEKKTSLTILLPLIITAFVCNHIIIKIPHTYTIRFLVTCIVLFGITFFPRFNTPWTKKNFNDFYIASISSSLILLLISLFISISCENFHISMMFKAILVSFLMIFFTFIRESETSRESRKKKRILIIIFTCISILPFIEAFGATSFLYKANRAIENNEFQKASTLLKKILKLNPQDSATHLQLGKIYSLHKEKEKAQLHFRKSLRYFPNHEAIFRMKAGPYIQKEMWNSVARLAMEHTILDVLRPDDNTNTPNLLPQMGKTFLKAGRPQEAILFLEKCIKKGENSPEIILSLGEALLENGNYQQLDNILHKANDLVLENDSARYLTARAKLVFENYESAAKDLEVLSSTIKNSTFLHFQLGKVFELLKKDAIAQKHYLACLDKAPDFLDAALKLKKQGFELSQHLQALEPDVILMEKLNFHVNLVGINFHMQEQSFTEFYAVTFWQLSSTNNLNEKVNISKLIDTGLRLVNSPDGSAIYFVFNTSAIGFHRKNLIYNGTFEEDELQRDLPSRWEKVHAYSSENLYQVTRDITSTGNVLSISNAQNQIIIGAASRKFDISPDSFFINGGWLRTENGTGYLGRRWFDSSGRAMDYSYGAKNVISPTWKLFLSIAKSPTTAASCQMWLIKHRDVGTAHFDNLFFFPVHDPWKLLEDQAVRHK